MKTLDSLLINLPCRTKVHIKNVNSNHSYYYGLIRNIPQHLLIKLRNYEVVTEQVFVYCEEPKKTVKIIYVKVV